MRTLLHIAAAVGVLTIPLTPASAADLVVAPPPSADVAYDIVPGPLRRYLTTYMAKYPFGVLREDYTPLGAPGVSKRDYYGVPRLTATLHVSPRRWARRSYHKRVIVSARF